MNEIMMHHEVILHDFFINSSILTGNSMCLNVTVFNFLKLDSTAAELEIVSPYPKMGIIRPDHKGNNFIHFKMLRTKFGANIAFVLKPSVMYVQLSL